MKPIDFPERTVMVAENQDEYLTLPAFQDEIDTISRWQFTWRERVLILFGAGLWIRQRNRKRAVQPLLPQVNTPFEANREMPWS